MQIVNYWQSQPTPQFEMWTNAIDAAICRKFDETVPSTMIDPMGKFLSEIFTMIEEP